MERVLPRTNYRSSVKSRLWCGLGGGALILYGLSKKSMFGGILSVIGADLLVSGASGHQLGSFAGLVFPRLTTGAIPHQLGVQVRRSICVGVEPEKAYAFIRDVQNMPKFMKHVESVTALDGNRSHWVVRGPGNMSVSWDSRIINEVPNELIAWRSEPCAQIENAGSIWFEKAPKNLGTIIRVTLQFLPPGGAMATLVAKLFGKDPERQVDGDLKRLKQLLETGEIATTEGQPVGSPQGMLAVLQRGKEIATETAEGIKSSSEPDARRLRRSAYA